MQASDFTDADTQNLADIIWWIRGGMAADSVVCPFNGDHIESLRKARVIIQAAKMASKIGVDKS